MKFVFAIFLSLASVVYGQFPGVGNPAIGAGGVFEDVDDDWTTWVDTNNPVWLVPFDPLETNADGYVVNYGTDSNHVFQYANTPVWTIVGTNPVGQVEHAFYFNGVNEWLYPTNAADVMTTNVVTAFAWVYYESDGDYLNDGGTWASMMGGQNDSQDHHWSIWTNGSQYTRIGGSFNLATNDPTPTNEWVMLTVVLDSYAASLDFYTNGVLIDESGENDNWKMMTIGGRPPWATRVWQGYIADFRMYNKAFTPAMIADQYTNTLMPNGMHEDYSAY